MSDYFLEHACHVHVEDPNIELSNLVKKWWTTESFGCSYDIKHARSAEDERALQILESTTRKVGDRYETGLLWKDSEVKLPSNRPLAEARLESLERRLDRNPELKEAYVKSMQSDIEKGYLKKLSPEEMVAPVVREWFLPHHPVINPNKPGKVRRVFDAAAKYQGTSLNDCLITGPNLLKPLNSVLMSFRENPVALSADIEGMYSQVLVPEVDQSVLRFLWRENRDRPPDVYQFQRHIFGAKSSPTSAIFALQQTAKDSKHLFPEAAEIVNDAFYMDDNLFSVDSPQRGSGLQKDLVSMLGTGGFRLTKWCSNSPKVLSGISPDELAPSLKDIGNAEAGNAVERVLGIRWDTARDSFIFDIRTNGHSIYDTPRRILSKTASIFDPLGILAPCTLIPKLLMQDLWRMKLGWDDQVPDAQCKLFSDWLDGLEHLKSLSVPRFYRDYDMEPSSVQLHVFCDASEKAFSAAAFYRFEYENGRVNCRFVIGKSRVAPVKPLTIPKLELQAAVLGTRLAQSVLSDTKYSVSETHYWSDSTTVLQWIRGTTTRHPTFIASRIAEILDESKPGQWHHVPGKVNVADDGSRGLQASEITNGCRWLNGPAFLLLPRDAWPEFPRPVDQQDVGQQFTGHTSGDLDDSSRTQVIDVHRFSSWNRLWRSTARVLRFVNYCRRKSDVSSDVITVEDKAEAQNLLIKQAQSEAFGSEVKALQSGKPISKGSPLRKLAPFLDENGIIRSRGRIGKSNVAYEVKYPIILSPKSWVTKLIVRHTHLINHHEGMDYVRNEVRQRYWVLKSRSAIRKILFGCMFCRRRNATPCHPIMGDLPEVRVQEAGSVFSTVGCDYAGPVLVRKFRRVEKRYIVVYICIATKAVHIEMADSLDTSSMIMSLRRFIGRRGKPRHIYSDNGTNFVGADRELGECVKNWDHQQIADALLEFDTQWHFNPPAAPHFGGLWERMVKSVKRAMRAVLMPQQVVLTDEVLRTVLVETDALLNSRPLTSVSDDPRDLEAITPNHFLIGRACPNLPPDIFHDSDINSRKRWRQSQILVDHVWKRWSREYLPTLNERKRWWASQGQQIKLGDLVLMIDHGLPRGSWPMGRVERLYPGADGVVRVVEIRTKHGVYKRPVVKLVSLEERQ